MLPSKACSDIKSIINARGERDRLNNTEKFTGKAAIYDKARPRYAVAAIDNLYQSEGFSPRSVIADIGSGTGILTQALLERGSTVYAVESNADMRLIAEKNLSLYPSFTSVSGTAENTTLPDGSVDIVTAAQAFHWFDKNNFRLECRRILKPDGQIVLVYNHKRSGAFTEEYEKLQAKHCPNFKSLSGSPEDKEAVKEFFNDSYKIKTFNNNLPVSQAQFIEGNLSASYALQETDNGFADYLKDIKALFEKYADHGVLYMPYDTACYIGT
jgi:ubiquinone/menaquinone biosynthesis C-methylase UbiE